VFYQTQYLLKDLFDIHHNIWLIPNLFGTQTLTSWHQSCSLHNNYHYSYTRTSLSFYLLDILINIISYTTTLGQNVKYIYSHSHMIYKNKFIIYVYASHHHHIINIDIKPYMCFINEPQYHHMEIV